MCRNTEDGIFAFDMVCLTNGQQNPLSDGSLGSQQSFPHAANFETLQIEVIVTRTFPKGVQKEQTKECQELAPGVTEW